MGKESFLKSKRFAYIALIMALLGIAIKLTVVFTFDNHLIKEFPELINGWNYFGFFTVLTNFMVDLWLILLAISIFISSDALNGFLTRPFLQGFITVMIFTVGFIYCFIMFWFDIVYSASLWWGNLANFWNHAIVPTIIVLLYFRTTDGKKLSMKNVALWMVYPLAYLIFSMIRGNKVGWYPYPFLEAGWEIYAELDINPTLGIAICIAFLFFFILGAGTLAMRIHNKRITRK